MHSGNLLLQGIHLLAEFLILLLLLFFVGGAYEVILHSIHRVCPMQYYGAAVVHVTDQYREDILLCHVRLEPLVLADVLYNLPCLLVDKRFIGVFDAHLLCFQMVDSFFIFE